MLDVSNSIETAFSRSAESYHGLATVQKNCAERILSLLDKQKVAEINSGVQDVAPRRILELGCGTGFLTKGLIQIFPQAQITALDISSNMLSIAEEYCESTSQITWVEADAREFEFSESYDLILASSSLQWMEPLDALLPKIRSALLPQGRFLFLIMLKETFSELHELRRELFPKKLPFSSFREATEIETLLQKSGFKIENSDVSSLERRAVSGWELLKSLSRSGLTRGPVSRGKSLLSRTELIQLAEEYSERFAAEKGGVRATYQVGLFSAAKNNLSKL